MTPAAEITEALGRLDELTRRLRVECPWDREQDERSIVPHTVEEAYELADAAQRAATTPSCSTSSATSSSRSTSSRCCSRSAARATSPPSPSTAARSSSAATRTSSATSRSQTAGEVLRNWDADQGDRGGPRAGHLRRGAREPARRCSTRARSSAAPRRPGLLERAPEPDAAPRERGATPSTTSATAVRRRRRGAPPARRPRARPARGRRSASATASKSQGDHEPDRTRPRPPDPRQPRQPDGRGRARAALRRHRPRRGARRARRPASSRPPSCATAATRGAARASRRPSPTSTARSPRRSRGRDAARPGRARPRAHRPRRHAEQVAPGRQRDPRRVAGRRARRGRARSGQPLWRYLGGEARARPAGADDERPQRRRARRQQGRLPGVHGRAGGRGVVRRVPAHGRRGLPRAEEDAARRAASAPPSATRAASRPTSAPTRRRCEMLVEGIEAAGYAPGEDVAIALDPATSEIFDDGAYVLEHEGRTLVAARDGRLLGRPRRALPDRLDRGRHGRGGLGRLEGADRRASATASSSSATTSSSRTPSA